MHGATATRHASPLRVNHRAIRFAIVSTPPNRCEQPRASSHSPSGSHTPTRGENRPARTASRPSALVTSPSSSASWCTSRGSKARAWLTVIPACTPRSRASAQHDATTSRWCSTRL
ncbi:MAG: hypothetical protein K2Q20_02990, partial [Phycisphaerales bacterium]|nr:hypothetical protein [Phycisphaerales bacterium]